MTSEEKWVQKVLRSMVKHQVQTALMTQELSQKFLIRSDTKAIEQEIEIITDKITKRFVAKLKAKGYIGTESNAPAKEFRNMFLEAKDEYFATPESSRE
jgi:uncharacterized protein YaaW (UPF0174 family)